MFFSKYLSFVLIGVGVFTVYMAVVGLLRKDRNQSRAAKIVVDIPEEEESDGLGRGAIVVKQLLMLFGIDINRQRESVVQLSKAGYNSQSSLIYFLFLKRFVQPVLFGFGAFLLVELMIFDRAKINDNLDVLMLGLLLVIIGAYGSKLFLSNSAAKRSKQLVRSFPDALDLILICVESGLGIDAAFARVCKEMKESHPVVAAEFDRTRFEMTMMSDRIQALQNFGDRTGLGSVRSLVSSLIQAEKFGTSLIDTMRTIAEEQRTERMMNAEARAARLPALVTLPLIIFILPGLFMIILGPAIIKLNEQGGIFGPVDR